MVAHTCYLNIGEAEAGGLIKFKSSLGYIERQFEKQTKGLIMTLMSL